MTELLIYSTEANGCAAGVFFGGLPLAPRGEAFAWPSCGNCSGFMEFLVKVDLPEQGSLALVFMCGNDPGLCDEWEPNGGGNAVVLVRSSDLVQVSAPPTGSAVRPMSYGAEVIQIPTADYFAAVDNWAASTGRPSREVLGQVGGEPAWVQADETPDCSCCSKPMRFVAQFEQGPDWETEMNFGGGGAAYLFVCAAGHPVGKFLWQC